MNNLLVAESISLLLSTTAVMLISAAVLPRLTYLIYVDAHKLKAAFLNRNLYCR